MKIIELIRIIELMRIKELIRIDEYRGNIAICRPANSMSTAIAQAKAIPNPRSLSS
jgi:hypothetical protein